VRHRVPSHFNCSLTIFTLFQASAAMCMTSALLCVRSGITTVGCLIARGTSELNIIGLVFRRGSVRISAQELIVLTVYDSYFAVNLSKV